jgi:hypothetical protein
MGEKHKRMLANDDGWSDWISPRHEKLQLSCCGCGLVHTFQFKAVNGEDVEKELDGVSVLFRCKR